MANHLANLHIFSSNVWVGECRGIEPAVMVTEKVCSSRKKPPEDNFTENYLVLRECLDKQRVGVRGVSSFHSFLHVKTELLFLINSAACLQEEWLIHLVKQLNSLWIKVWLQWFESMSCTFCCCVRCLTMLCFPSPWSIIEYLQRLAQICRSIVASLLI